MRILVFTNTPAHVHTYKHAVRELVARGHDVLVLGRDYDCTADLLDFYDLPYECYGRHGTDTYTRLRFARELGGHLVRIARHALAFRPDVVFGRGPYAAYAGTLTRAPVVLVLDDEPTDFNHEASRPFADLIVSPEATRRDLGERHYTFRGFKECAYLHPDVFEPVGDVRRRLGVAPDEDYVLVRFNALDALHDVGIAGFSPAQRADLIEALAAETTVFVSDEGGTMDLDGLPARPYDLHPALVHDAMAEAELLVADTGTMIIEAALLGTPAIRYSGTDTTEFGEFATLESNGLVFDLDEYGLVREQALAIVRDEGASGQWRRLRDEYVADLVDLTDVLVTLAESRGNVEGTPLSPRESTPIEHDESTATRVGTNPR